MAEEKQGASGFKVVDRRSHAADGTPREAREEENRSRPPAPLQAELPSQEPNWVEQADEGATDFETLVSYLSTTAMFQLGLLAGPTGERIPADLVNAERTINLLEILQQKTRGNLTPDEERFLEDTLYELRLSYVEMTNRQKKKAK